MMNEKPRIYIVSGGAGTSAEQVVNTVLAQFPDSRLPVVTISNVRYPSQLENAIQQAQTCGGLIVHTLVDSHLRAEMTRQAAAAGVPAIDLMAGLIEQISQLTGQSPLEQPGLYRKLNKPYYDRVAAIEYAMAHDDGKNPGEWSQADVLLLGVSRSGKTPLSLYLSVLGWKAANLPLVPQINLPDELEQMDRSRVIGLKIEAGQLLLHRRQRQRHLGAPGLTDYTNPERVADELDYAYKIYQRLGCKVLDVTDKPIESSADEVIRIVSRLGVI